MLYISSSRKSTKCDTFFDYFGENPNALFHRYAHKKTNPRSVQGCFLVCDSHGHVAGLELSSAEPVERESKTEGHLDTLVNSLRIGTQCFLRMSQRDRRHIRSAWFLHSDTCDADCKKLLATDAEDKLLLFDMSRCSDQSSNSYDDFMHLVFPSVQTMFVRQGNLNREHSDSRNLQQLAPDAQFDSSTLQEFDDEFLDIDFDVAGARTCFHCSSNVYVTIARTLY